MSSDPGAPPTPRRKPLSPRVRIGLMLAAGVIVVVVLVSGISWLLHGRFMITTDDAYLRADAVNIAPRVSGYIDEIYVKENQHVAAGQPLLHIDKRNYQDTLSQQSASVAARTADLDAADSQIAQQGAVIAQNRAQLASARAKALFSREQAQRYRALRDQGADTEEKYAQLDNERVQNDAAEAAANAGLHRAAEPRRHGAARERRGQHRRR